MLDLFGTSFVLLTGSEDKGWSAAGRRLARRARFPYECYRIGSGGDLLEVDRSWHDAYGVTATGAVLVRPDGFVAWRSLADSREAEATLSAVCARLGVREG